MNRSRYVEYQVWWRFADNHDPNGWLPLGKPHQDLTILIEIMGPEDYKPGMEWKDTNPFNPQNGPEHEVIYKIMQRTVSLSDFRNMDVKK